MNTCVAIPVGGCVNPIYLQKSLESVKQSGAVLYVGFDSQESLISLKNYDVIREICYQYADKVLEFPPEYYYRPGGIWKKIYDCWKDSGCKYVRCLGYDDCIPPDLIQKQDAFLEANSNLDACYSNLRIIDDLKESDKFFNTKLSLVNRVQSIGRSVPFNFICWLVRFDFLNTPEYERMLMKASARWEWFFYATVVAGKVSHFDSDREWSAIRREHINTITSQYEIQGLNERNELLRQIREMVNYSEAETWADWESLNMPAYYSRKRLETSLPLGTLSNLGVLGLLIRLARVTSRFSKKA